MDQVKKNAYWIAMGAIALAALIFWGVTVAAGLNTKIARDTKTLGDQVKRLEKFARIEDKNVANPEPDVGLPVDPVVKYWEERRKNLAEEKEEILKKYRARDKRFEELFAGGAPGKIDFTSWVTEFRKRAGVNGELRSQFKDLLEQDTDDAFAKAFPIKEPEKDDDMKVVVAQKQFYMAQAIGQAVKAVAPKKATIVEMQFGSKEPDPKSKATVERHDVTVELRFPAPLTAALVSKLLQSSLVVFEVRELKIEAAPFTLPAFKEYKVFEERAPGIGMGGPTPSEPAMKGFAKDVYVATKDSSNPKTKEGPPTLEEPAVGVKLTLSALDFQLPEPAAAPK